MTRSPDLLLTVALLGTVAFAFAVAALAGQPFPFALTLPAARRRRRLTDDAVRGWYAGMVESAGRG